MWGRVESVVQLSEQHIWQQNVKQLFHYPDEQFRSSVKQLSLLPDKQ
jgi:hypothetical protein